MRPSCPPSASDVRTHTLEVDTMACKLGQLIGNTHTLSPLDRGLVRAWLDTGRDAHGRRVAAETMAQALTADGHRVGPTTLKDHRGRRCVCFLED